MNEMRFPEPRTPFQQDLKRPPSISTLPRLLIVAFFIAAAIDIAIGWQSFFYLTFPSLLVGFGIFHAQFCRDIDEMGIFWTDKYIFFPTGDSRYKSTVFLLGGICELGILLVWGIDLLLHPQMFGTYERPVLVIFQSISALTLYLAYYSHWREVGVKKSSQMGQKGEEENPSIDENLRVGLPRDGKQTLVKILQIFFVTSAAIVVITLFPFQITILSENNPFRGNNFTSTLAIPLFPLLNLGIFSIFGIVTEVLGYRFMKREIETTATSTQLMVENRNFLTFLRAFY